MLFWPQKTPTQALSLAQEVLERKRINGSTEMFLDRNLADPALATYTSGTMWMAPPATNCFGTTANCTPAQMAQYDIGQILALANSNSYLANGSIRVAFLWHGAMTLLLIVRQLMACLADWRAAAVLYCRGCRP